jgi:hypothetical protein
VETRFSEKMNRVRKQLDNRWKQIDKFEASIKSYADIEASWRRRFSSKEDELEAVKVCLLHFGFLVFMLIDG